MATTPTQLAARLEAVTRQLYRYKLENHRLSASLSELVSEVEARAPAMQSMRREWEEAQRARERVSAQLRRALAGHAELESALADMRTREAALQSHCADLGRQLAVVLHGQMQSNAEQSENAVDHLVAFDDVAAMQRQNAQLLLALRSAQQQAAQAGRERQQLHAALDELKVRRVVLFFCASCVTRASRRHANSTLHWWRRWSSSACCIAR